MVGFVGKTQSIVVGFVEKTQSIVVRFVVKSQRIVVECLRLNSGLPIITADFAQSLQAPSLRQQQISVDGLFAINMSKFVNHKKLNEKYSTLIG